MRTLFLSLALLGCSGSHSPDAGDLDAGTDASVDASFDANADAGRDTHCDEGLLLCNAIQPTCDAGSIPAIQNGCWSCVNPLTCRAWGEPGCESDMGCAATERCNPCGTSSCPACLDCVAACTPHGCPTETVLTCRCARPDCEGFSVIQDGCWQCVTPDSCSPVGGPTRC